MSPEHIRREVFILRTDFNYRLKLVYFESMMTVYYGCFIPFLFCKVYPKSVDSATRYKLQPNL